LDTGDEEEAEPRPAKLKPWAHEPDAEGDGHFVEYKFEELEALGLLGKGSYGTVTLVRCHLTGQLLALKAIAKDRFLFNPVHRPHFEKEAMQAVKSPFLVQFLASFLRGQHVYLLQEAAIGGDLHRVYRQQHFYGLEPPAHFYVASVVCALERLHSKDIIFRDLKMENLVLDKNGICKLCDFGAAKIKPQPQSGAPRKTYTLCGTPAYMAPEVICGSGHYCAADWWSLGILVYEMFQGKTPLDSEDSEEIYSKVRSGFSLGAFLPADAGAWAKLVNGLCQSDPRQRLPFLPSRRASCRGSAQKVKAHAWFADVGFDWTAFEQCRLPVPYVPDSCRPDELPSAPSLLSARENISGAPASVEAPGEEAPAWAQGFEEARGPAHLG
jgi:serine/threonine protein kinase